MQRIEKRNIREKNKSKLKVKVKQNQMWKKCTKIMKWAKLNQEMDACDLKKA
jgi:hypothetical protein